MRSERPPLSRAPVEGWLTVGLVLVMCVTLARAIAGAAWVLGRAELTEFLTLPAIGGVVAGFVGAKAGWGRLTAHLVGATFAGLLVPILVGGVLPGGAGGSWPALFQATANSTVDAVLDLSIRGQAITRQYGHFLLVLGLLVWATSQFVASATFRHRRPLGGVVIAGLALVVNMSATPRDELPYLIVFSVAALLLLVRLHAIEEQATWVRRRIGDPVVVGSIYLRGGTAFVGASVLAALFLTGTASSAPLAGAAGGVGTWLVAEGRGLQRYFPFIQSVRGPVTVDFGPAAPITGRWITDSTVALRIARPADDRTPYYWAAAAYDRFDGAGWSWSGGSEALRDSGAAILAGTLDAPTAVGRRSVTVTVQPLGFRGSSVVSPGPPAAVDRPTRLTTLTPDGFFAALDTAASATAYTVQALVPILGDANPGGITANRLRAAGTAYPSEVAATYLSVPPGVLGPDSLALLDSVMASLPRSTPYDLATALVAEFHSAAFTYDTDVTDLDCGGRSVVECFARFRRGYCQYYASTMALLLRHEGIPTRLVQGFLPGERSSNGVETIRNSNSHAWVQVYFPGYAWVDFDPTGGNVSRAAPIPEGRPVATPSAAPRASAPGDDTGPDRPRQRPGPSGPAGEIATGSGPAASIAFAVLLAVVVGALAFAAYRRSPRDLTPDQAYRGVARLAGRFGFGPRPTQTIFEYADTLGELLPVASSDLRTVAFATVEVTYGRRRLGDERLGAVRAAAARLRVTLLRLLFRRRRGGRRRS